jgi:hypothetical protein
MHPWCQLWDGVDIDAVPLPLPPINCDYVAGLTCPRLAAVQFGMANLSLVYGLRLLPEGELEQVGSGKITLKNGREEHVTLHLLEGSKEEIEAQLKLSIEAFFDIYPEIQ